jgi:hypothetical protein
VPGRRLVTAQPAAHALFVLTRKLSGRHKRTVNARVVVVGASETGLACVEHLLQVSSLGDVKSSLGDAESSLGDAKSSLGDAKRLAG